LSATLAGKYIGDFHSDRSWRETTLGKASKQPHRGRAIRKRCNAKAHCTLRLLQVFVTRYQQPRDDAENQEFLILLPFG
jgi:hypothetical protein